ncbi:glycosyltransferase [Nocardioides perillae]|uniref:GT2 family glycosyltransferase n=1 Tax=Nocardioides perillae TaxID=1119534 RepID=A0A7Y9RPV0_9ACTN|nr:GT2 family glycosyltransferase [Nocardioides perillae]
MDPGPSDASRVRSSADPGERREPTTSVVVCAHTERRWTSIVAGLQALAAQSRRPDQVLLVVDHDDALLRRAAAELPGLLGLGGDDTWLTVLPNTRGRGLSGARNTGVHAGVGDVVAFLDDDAVPAPDWLDRLVTALAETGADGVDGRATPVWPPSGRPRHLVAELDWVVGCSYRGLPEHRAPVRNLLGATMSFTRAALELAGDFDEAAGRVGDVLLGGEETELCLRLARRKPGALLVHEPAATVAHHVSADRTTWRYLARRAYAEGLSKAHIARTAGPGAATSTERAYVRRVLPAAVRRELRSGAEGGPRGAAGVVVGLASAGAGYARGSLRRAGRTDRRATALRAPEGAR